MKKEMFVKIFKEHTAPRILAKAAVGGAIRRVIAIVLAAVIEAALEAHIAARDEKEEVDA